jgi:hypothetical protein
MLTRNALMTWRISLIRLSMTLLPARHGTIRTNHEHIVKTGMSQRNPDEHSDIPCVCRVAGP